MEGARAAGDVLTEFLAANNLISFHESGELAAACPRGRSADGGAGEKAALESSATGSPSMRGALVNLDANSGAYDLVVTPAGGVAWPAA